MACYCLRCGKKCIEKPAYSSNMYYHTKLYGWCQFHLKISQICHVYIMISMEFNPLNPELNPICSLLALLGANHFLHVSRIKVKSLTLRLLMSYIYIYIYIYMYIYGAPILDVSRSHTTTQHSR